MHVPAAASIQARNLSQCGGFLNTAPGRSRSTSDDKVWSSVPDSTATLTGSLSDPLQYTGFVAVRQLQDQAPPPPPTSGRVTNPETGPPG